MIDDTEPRPLQYFLSRGYGTDHAGVEFYKRLVENERTVIATAGPFKLPAIRAALTGKLMNVWVTDEDTASRVLAEPE
jgi:DNA-binding transcriptional regulator LsrR (DeoR family)